MPERFRIGTATAFEKEYAFVYEKKLINEEIIYFCSTGSKWARPDEFLMLRFEEGTWTAYDTAFLAHGKIIPVKRSSVAMEQTLHSQDGISGIARIFGLKPRCYDAMMYFA